MKKQLLGLCALASMLFIAKTSTAQYALPVRTLDIPYTATAPTLDGEDDATIYSDWQTTTITKKAGAGIPEADYTTGMDGDFTVQFKVAWDLDYLFLLVDVQDQIAEYYSIGKNESWTWDNIEGFIDLDTNSTTGTYSSTSTTQMRFCPGLVDAAGDDSLFESNARGVGALAIAKRAALNFFEDATVAIDGTTPGYHFELQIPWASATDSATVDIQPMTVQGGGTVVGFDIGAADSDGDGSGSVGNRNTTGGKQAFWDLDNPAGTGNEDNAYSNRRNLGQVTLTGTYVPRVVGVVNPIISNSLSVFPNPTYGIVNISNINTSTVEVMNVAGQSIKVPVVNGQIDITNLSSGTYFIKAENSVAKIMKR